jgi:hypothetical protein
MSDTLQRNVYNLNSFDKSRKTLSPAEALALLHACRDQVIEDVCRVWQNKRTPLQDHLLLLADQSPTLETRNLYHSAQNILQHRSEVLVLALRKHFVEAFESQIRTSERGSNQAKAGGLSMELSLIDEDDFEQSLALNKAAARLRYDSVEELAALDQRIAALLRDPHAKEEGNPLGAKAICQAFLSACDQLEAEAKVKLVLLQQFDQQIARELPGIYQRTNQFLVGKEILPTIRVGLSTPKERSPRVNERHETGGATATDNGQDLFALLQRLLAQSAGASVSTGGGMLGKLSTGGSNHVAASEHTISIPLLTQLQRGEAISTGGLDPALLHNGSVNILHDLRSSGMVANDNHVDAFTIDIVAMLFDYIFDDRSIPDKLKALIGRLQIPVLKVAMLDKQFFSKKSHPARRLLDEIAAASIGWCEEGEYNLNLYQQIDTIVQSILADFSDDVSLFASLLDSLQAFMQTQQINAETAVELSSQALEIAERKEIASVVVEDKIRQASSGKTLPEAIQTFLAGPWHQVLTHAFVETGEASPAWQVHLQTMHDLIWSVAAKRNTEDRLSLVVMLPDLLKHLREGMNSIQIDPREREIVFSKLVTCHADAVKAGLQYQQVVQNSPSLSAHDTADSVVEIANYTQTENESYDLSAVSDPDEPEDEHTACARNLKKGVWMSFLNEDGSERLARLSWISSLRGIYLFTNNQGLEALTIALPRLASRLRLGEAHILESSPLTERAVENLISNLQPGQ